MMVQGQSPYTIEEFKNETNIFYENQGEIRIIGAHRELLELEIRNIDEHCKGNNTDHEMCSKYDNVLKTTFNEMSVQRKQMYESIGRYLPPTGGHTTPRSARMKRGIFTALMTQYSYVTQTLSAIITAARTSVLNPSLVTPRELAAQLVDVKLNLPLNLNLPMGTLPSEIHEFTKITKIAVYYSGSQIVFLIKIPLITETQLTLFKIIPIPHSVDIDRTNNKAHSVVLKPEYQYVGITKNRRQFTTFTETELLHCTETETFTICPEFQPIKHELKEQPCEILLFKNLNQLPLNCESGVVVISKNIFHKLKYANTWIYTTRTDTLTITCQEYKNCI
ncbi:hypothetical protein AGLY_017398 [Aphis glycines]|uniref:Envelope fusion protein n=1 Tax=Aphis glycines TaxID=307491 RepID=A0A6G0SV12_APHGL|nr:hypothetical protein AGLY_017398 [Aphis glycines]